MSIDYERVGKRLADAERRRLTAIENGKAAKTAESKADAEIKECLTELASGEASRPLLDAIDRKAEADERQRGPTSSWKRPAKSKSSPNVAAERPDRKLRPRGAEAEALERIAREAEHR